jgi:hypothetical protein
MNKYVVCVSSLLLIILLISYHNIDLVVNVSKFACLSDTNPFGNVTNGERIYLNGMMGIWLSVLLAFTMILYELLFEKVKK